MTKTLAFPTPQPDEGAHAAAGAEALIAPHGGQLVDLLVSPARAAELKAASRDWPSWDLTPRQTCDLELLLDGLSRLCDQRPDDFQARVAPMLARNRKCSPRSSTVAWALRPPVSEAACARVPPNWFRSRAD